MTIKQKLQNVGRTIGKNSPAIFTGLGIVGLGATAYFAYKSRDGVEEIIESVEEAREQGHDINRWEVTKDLAGVLALPVTTGLLSGACIITAHRIQNQRIGALSSALLAQQARNVYFEQKYKKQHGEEEYQKFITPVETETRTITDEKGKEKKVEVDIRQDTNDTVGEWFDKSSEYAEDDHSYNVSFIEAVNEKMQTRLFQKGHLLLNEVRDELGFERSRAGQLFGWSTADVFDIQRIVTNERTPEGDIVPQIWVTWSTPKYIWNDVDLHGRYSPFED